MLRFVFMADPHVDSGDYTDPKEPATNFAFAATLNPAFAILPGDLTGFAASNSFRKFSNLITTNWSIPTYYTSGNHDKNEDDDISNPDWLWWDMMMQSGPNNPQGTNRNYSFTNGPFRFILFQTYSKTNVPDVAFGVIETNTAIWVWQQMSNCAAESKIPILVTHYQIATNWPWGPAKWPITQQPPSDLFTLTNGIHNFSCQYSFSGHAHATNNIGWRNSEHTNICLPSLRSIDCAGTISTGILTNGGLTLVRVFTNAMILDLYLCDSPTYTFFSSTEIPLASRWRSLNVINSSTIRVGTIIRP